MSAEENKILRIRVKTATPIDGTNRDDTPSETCRLPTQDKIDVPFARDNVEDCVEYVQPG